MPDSNLSDTRRNSVPLAPFRFLALAPEIRNLIYCHALVKNFDISLDHKRRPYGSKIGFCTALLRTCRQIYREGTAILYGENSFKIHVNLLTHFPRDVQPWNHRFPRHISQSAHDSDTPGAVYLTDIGLMKDLVIDLDPKPCMEYEDEFTMSHLDSGPRQAVMDQMRGLSQILIRGETLRRLKIVLFVSWQSQDTQHIRRMMELLRPLRNVELKPIELVVGLSANLGLDYDDWQENLREEIARGRPRAIG